MSPGHAGDLDHANARILAAHELTGRGIAQAKSGAAPLEPEPESLLGPPFRHAADLVAAGHARGLSPPWLARRVFPDEADTAFVTNVVTFLPQTGARNDACRGRWRSKGGRRLEKLVPELVRSPLLEVEQTARSRDDPLRRRHVSILDLPVRYGTS